jgi:hypothetical protein
MNITPEQLIQHLFYEVWMLGEMRKAMQEGKAVAQPTKNAVIEAFCIHARNLNEFFLGNGKDDSQSKRLHHIRVSDARQR